MDTVQEVRAGDVPRTWPAFVAAASFASLPYVQLLAANVGEALELHVVAGWWMITLAFAVAPVLIAARRGARPARRTAVLVSVLLFLLFNYPAITELRQGLGVGPSGTLWWLLVTAIALVAAMPLRRHLQVQGFVALWGVGLLVLPLIELGSSVTQAAADDIPPAVAAEEPLELTPDIFWFMLDGLAGPPFLREVGVDVDAFNAALEEHGFSVQEQATSNYPFTHLAVASTLEMRYLYEGVKEPKAGPYLERMRGENRTVQTLRANGYGYVHAFPGLWRGSRCDGHEDVCLGAHGSLSDTVHALASRTPFIEAIADDRALATVARVNDPLAATEQVLQNTQPGPTYAFIHLLNPHPPYLRDEACELRTVPLDMAAWGIGPEYRDATTCLLDRLEQAVDAILATDDDPVILITGDHGPRFGLDGDTRGRVLLDGEMFASAYSAIRLPRSCDTRIPDDLTFVNTFRIVFACLRGEPPDLLEDRWFPIEREYK